MKLFLYFLYAVAFLFGLFVVTLVFNSNPLHIQLDNKASLLSALGIILSAFIASLSVLLSIENTKKIETERQKKELNEELSILKFKTSVLKNFLSHYFRDNSHYKKTLSESDISENCIQIRDESYELIEKLNNYEEFVDAKVKSILKNDNILETLQDIIHNIAIVRAEENFKKEPFDRKIRIEAHLEQTLINNLEKLNIKLEEIRKDA